MDAVEMALKEYQNSKAASRRRKVGKASVPATAIDEDSTLPANLEIPESVTPGEGDISTAEGMQATAEERSGAAAEDERVKEGMGGGSSAGGQKES